MAVRKTIKKAPKVGARPMTANTFGCGGKKFACGGKKSSCRKK